MSVKLTISTPTPGRVVLFTAFRGHETAEKDEYPGIVVKHHGDGVVDLVTFGPNSIYHNHKVKHLHSGEPQGWRYPPHSADMIDIPVVDNPVA
jgi:hypothetical protein